MKKLLSLMLVLAMLLGTVPALAEDWICASCGSTVSGNFCNNCGAARPVDENAPWTCPTCGAEATGKFCSSCGTAKPGSVTGTVSQEVLTAIADATSHTPVTVEPSPDKYTWHIRDYVGMNLASVGYTSLGGERRETYGAGNVKLTLVTVDGTYADIEDDDLLRQYVVIGQSPAANTVLTYTFEKDSSGKEYSNLIDSKSYEEIDLLIARTDGVVYNDLISFDLAEISPSPDKYTCYIRNYVGKNLCAIGYTSMGGERRDSYSDTNIKLVLSTTDGTYVDVEDDAQMACYVVTRQDVAPNSEMKLVYTKDSKGKEYSNLVDSKSYDQVVLTLKKIEPLPTTKSSTSTEAEDTTADEEPSEPAAPAADAGSTHTSGNFTYIVLEDGTAQITAYNGNKSSVSISSDLDDHEVSSIGPSAFEGHKEITTVIMWADPEEFCDACFKDCTGITSISISSDTTRIGKSAFEGCTALETVILWGDPEIEERAFYGCTALGSISIGSDTKSIGGSAFEGCTSLKSVILWGGTDIGARAFYGCTALDSISIDSDTKSIGDYAFYGCTSLSSAILWGSDTKIGAGAFDNCPKLNGVTQW